MKLNSNRTTDQADLELAWPYTSFETAEEVVGALWEAFPAAPDDPYLIGYVRQIISQTGKHP